MLRPVNRIHRSQITAPRIPAATDVPKVKIAARRPAPWLMADPTQYNGTDQDHQGSRADGRFTGNTPFLVPIFPEVAKRLFLVRHPFKPA